MIYFVMPVEKITDLMMAEAVETDIARLHKSLDGTLALLSVKGVPSYAFATHRRYTYEQIRAILETPEWDEEDDE